MKILIVDDSEFMRGILKDLVVQSKWKDAQIFEAPDGVEATTIYAAEKPDLVLLDIIMPKKDGISVLKEIGQSATAIVIVSSVGQEDIITQAKQLGAKDYIIKPFKPSDVIQTLDKLFN